MRNRREKRAKKIREFRKSLTTHDLSQAGLPADGPARLDRTPTLASPFEGKFPANQPLRRPSCRRKPATSRYKQTACQSLRAFEGPHPDREIRHLPVWRPDRRPEAQISDALRRVAGSSFDALCRRGVSALL